MPELPEVECVRRYLAGKLPGAKIESVENRLPRLVKNAGAADFSRALCGARFIGVDRKGKYLRLRTDGSISLLVHLRMTGRLVWNDAGEEPPATKIVFRLSRGTLFYGDVRTLGCLWLVPAEGPSGVPGFESLGPDALDDAFTESYFAQSLAQRRGTVKAALLDQRMVAGVGNIYADEALFAAGILPGRRCRSLSAGEAGDLRAALQRLMLASIEHGGTTFRDFLDGAGREGGNSPYLKVYGRRGCACVACGATLRFSRVAGRGTVWCPACQA